LIEPHRGRALLGALAFLGVVGGSSPATPRQSLPAVRANDNRVPAGRLDGDTLRIRLVVGMARWHPSAGDGPYADVESFAEEGKAPEIPGPLIRVREGTVIDATVRNSLADSTITVTGLATRPAGKLDSLVLRPGESARVQFSAGAPGTYFYSADIGRPAGFGDGDERQTASGAFIVDPAGGSPPDRIFVMNIWGTEVDSLTYREALTINGRSFPYTERLNTAVGDTVRWRWINATARNHPMHLHGFFFRVDSKGNRLADSIYASDQQRLAVTEFMPSFTTVALTWVPEREGNWLFHCHIGFHAVPDAQLDPPAEHGHEHYSGDIRKHMAGLVMAITVRPTGQPAAEVRDEVRRVRMFVQEGKPRGRAPRAMSFVFQTGDTPPAPDSVDIPGQPLVLTRGEPADVTILNRLSEPTSVHWHGLELESWSDGVAGWSGMGARVAPAIQPGDSFVAHLSLPRAGTFIYHTHLNDYEQLTSGMYGGIVVLERGQRYDPATDHLYVAGWDGPDTRGMPIVVNGDTVPSAVTFRAGVAHRLRFVNIGMAGRLRFRMVRDSQLVTWRAAAKDGADLPPAQATLGPATLRLGVGETADALFTPDAPGEFRLEIPRGDGPPRWSQKIVVQ